MRTNSVSFYQTINGFISTDLDSGVVNRKTFPKPVHTVGFT